MAHLEPARLGALPPLIFERIVEPAILCDRNLRVKQVNGAAGQLLRASESRAVGRNVGDVLGRIVASKLMSDAERRTAPSWTAEIQSASALPTVRIRTVGPDGKGGWAFFLESSSTHEGIPVFIGRSATTRELDALITCVAASSVPAILVEGETGTGKGLTALRLHAMSDRSRGRFASVNCANRPTDLANALFGTQGILDNGPGVRRGLLQDVRGGTLFLDEIDAMPLAIQALLLRVFESSDFAPAVKSIRIVAATRTDLLRAVDEGAFRADLYYRLTAMTIRMPPLREHPEDIQDLSMHYLENCNRTYMTGVVGIDSAALDLLCAYSWPGNVRELRDVIERAAMADNSAIVKPSSIQLPRQMHVPISPSAARLPNHR